MPHLPLYLQCGKTDGAERPRPFFSFRAKKPLHNEARSRERSDRGRFLPIGKKASTSTGVRTGCHYLNSLCVCVCVCVTFVVFSDCERCTRPTSTNPGSMEAGEYGLTRGRAFSRAVSRWSRSPDCCVFSGVFSVWRNFIFFR